MGDQSSPGDCQINTIEGGIVGIFRIFQYVLT